MKVYEPSQIRNVVLLGHGGAGKTTVAEALAYVSGAISKMGVTTSGNTISDFDKEEIKRGFSMSASIVPVEWDKHKINVLDTPGFFDFVGEAEEACSAAGAAVIVIDGKAGVQVGTQKAWNLCEKYNLPRMFFVTGMDDDHASFREVALRLESLYGSKIAPFHVPIRENEKFVGFVNVVKMQGRRFKPGSSDYEEGPIPDYVKPNLEKSRNILVEAVAETSDELMEKYFAGEEFTYEEISSTLRAHVIDNQIVPVLCGSGLNAQGTKMLLDCILKYFPSPEFREVQGQESSNSEMVVVKYDENKHFSGKIFKTTVDPFLGKYSMFKVVTGCLKSGDTIYDVTKDQSARAAKIYVLRGKEAIEVPEVHAGDIAALGKIDILSTGDTIAVPGSTMQYRRPVISTPYTYLAYAAKNKADDDKVATALDRMKEEDLTLKVVNNPETHQALLYGIGEQQLEVIASRIENRYKVGINLFPPKIAYRETIRKKVREQGKYKKQTGGSGQYGDVHIIWEPAGDLETQYVFAEEVVGGAVPKNYFPAVEKGVAECVQKGLLAGYPVYGIKATLVDGSYHPVDSSEVAFKQATILSYKKAYPEASPVILEPIATLSVTVPDAQVGDAMGDINKRRGRVLGMDPVHGGLQTVTADIPVAELQGYGTNLRAMTGGMGEFSYTFARYEQVPVDVQARIVEAAAKEKEEQ